MISIEKAREIAQSLIDRAERAFEITSISELHGNTEEESLYIFGVKDPKSNKHYYPGQLFPSIRKSDGELIDFALIPPGF